MKPARSKTKLSAARLQNGKRWRPQTKCGKAVQQLFTDRLGFAQRAYAHWERNPVALRTDQLLSLAQTLNVSVDDLVGTNETKKRGSGPTGKMKQLFEAASHLPRSQQQKIAALLEPFIALRADFGFSASLW